MPPRPFDLDYATPTPRRWRPDPAVVAFVGGLLFVPLCLFLFGGLHNTLNAPVVLVWLALGAISTNALRDAWPRPHVPSARPWFRRGAALLIAVGWLVGGLTLLFPAADPHVIARRFNDCSRNVSRIGYALTLYAVDHGGRMPDTLGGILGHDGVDAATLVSPAVREDTPARGATTREQADALAAGRHLSYVYVGKGFTDAALTARHVLLYEPLRNHAADLVAVHVLYGNGNVELLEGNAARRLIARVERGENPLVGPP